MTFAEAIAREEGFYVQNSRAQRNNNPGNLEFHSWMAGKYSAVMESGELHPRFARFPSADVGWQALRDLLGEHYLGLTLDAALEEYAPSSENNHAAYVNNVATWTGLDPETILTEGMLS